MSILKRILYSIGIKITNKRPNYSRKQFNVPDHVVKRYLTFYGRKSVKFITHVLGKGDHKKYKGGVV